MRNHQCSAVAVFAFVLFALALASASITGSISGVVTDPSGAVVSSATVVATNTQTGIKTTLTTDGKGFYSFSALPVGTYDIEVHQRGFKAYLQQGLVIDVNSVLRVDVALAVGQINEVMTVTSDAVHVETESTQMGDVITGKAITTVPLNGRSYTDLLALQPGVSPYNANSSGTPGLGDRQPSGGLNEGNQAINGQRETANGFMVNGSNVEEGKNNGTSIIPNLDSIDEFRIITNNFDAEYGNYSGGQINVATKSGTNRIHGDAFEFLRNTDFDARNYFNPAPNPKGDFKRNQFGGTLGGPIKRDKMFFFVDYQGTREIQGSTESLLLPSQADQGGNLFDQLDPLSLSNGGPTGSVSGPNFANVLQTRLQAAGINQQVMSGESYYFDGCTSADPNTGCVFPNAVIPQAAWSPVASHILPFIPMPNVANNPALNYSTSAFAQRLRDDKGGIRVDGNTRFGMISAYYFMDDFFLNSPYDSPGTSVPGFKSASLGRAQLVTLSDVATLNSTSVNEFRFSYVRNASNLKEPSGGLGQKLSSLGFTTGFSAAAGGIGPIDAPSEGVPNFGFNNFSLGVPIDTVHQFNNNFQVLDNFSKVIGTHSLKFGGQFHYDQINERNLYAENGQFVFNGGETGVDFADFLIGAPNQLTQASKQILDSRTKYMGLYFQDSWRATPNLTLNYGVRWEFSQPWYDTQNKIETIVPGEQSVVFPNAPQGWVVPGDPGIPPTLAPTKYNAFSPRLGLAYSPSTSDGFLGKLFGGPGKTSIRAGFGVYFTAVEDLSQFLEVGDPPYGLFYVSPVPPMLETPYIDRATGTSEGQRFPFIYPPTNVSAKNPDSSFNWSQVEPISSGFVFSPKNRLPYSEHYEFSLQRQVGSSTVVDLSYVGNQAHKLPTSLEANPVNAVQCLFLSNSANVQPNTPTCGPSSEDPSGGYFPLSGPPIPSLRPLGPAFASNPYEIEIANSTYNSLQASIKHTTGAATFLFGYTYSDCIDNASGLQDSTNPFNTRSSRGLCNFDVKQHFVGSYDVLLPFEKLVGSDTLVKKIVGGWSVSGIITFATGLPVSLAENDDNSLLGISSAPVDVPNFTPGHILNNTNPRSGQPYFNVSLFSFENLGQLGNSRRRFFHGPGLNNFDIALLKTTKITESKDLEFRAEAFNAFNHAQFQNPNGLINSSSFGLVSSANDPRILQVAMKFIF